VEAAGHGLWSMWQHQVTNQQELDDPAHAHRVAAPKSKWWHVSDVEIEQMVHRLNGPESLPSLQGSRRTSALRDRYASKSNASGDSWRRSVHFSDASRREDSLDQVIRQSADDSMRESLDGPTKKSIQKKGAWKVSDEALLEFIRNAKKALASDDEAEADSTASTRGYPLVNRSVLGNIGSRVLSDQTASASSYLRVAPKRQQRQGMYHGHSARSNHSRNSSAKSNLASRPPWTKCHSAPNLFARVGDGLDGKGNRLVSEFGRYEETPIYLSDARDKAFERVRVAVTGHPYYMPRH